MSPVIDYEFQNDDINRLAGIKARAVRIPNEVLSIADCEICLTPNIVAATCTHVTSPQTFIRLDYNAASFTFAAAETKTFSHTGTTSNGGTTWATEGRQTVRTFTPGTSLMTGSERLLATGACSWGMKIDDSYVDAKFRPEYVDGNSYNGGTCSSSSDYGPSCLLLPDAAGSQTLEINTGQTELFDPYYSPNAVLTHTNTLTNSTAPVAGGTHPSWTDIDLTSKVSTHSVYAWWDLDVTATTITLYLRTQYRILAYQEIKYTSGGHAMQDVYVIRSSNPTASVGVDLAFEPWHFDQRSMFDPSNSAAWSATSPTPHFGVGRTGDSNPLISNLGTSSNIYDTLDHTSGSYLSGGTHDISWTKSITAPISGTHTLTRAAHSGNLVTGSPTTIDVIF